MLTLRLITEDTERVIKGLEKKHFKEAREAINQVLETDKLRRETQQTLDNNLAEAKRMAALIGQMMKQGQREEAEKIKAGVAQLKETNKQLEADKARAEERGRYGAGAPAQAHERRAGQRQAEDRGVKRADD